MFSLRESAPFLAYPKYKVCDIRITNSTITLNKEEPVLRRDIGLCKKLSSRSLIILFKPNILNIPLIEETLSCSYCRSKPCLRNCSCRCTLLDSHILHKGYSITIVKVSCIEFGAIQRSLKMSNNLFNLRVISICI